MTHPKEHLSDEEIKRIWTCSLMTPEQVRPVFDQAKAYNTVKAERDALYKLIEGLDTENNIPRTQLRNLKTQAQTIKEGK